MRVAKTQPPIAGVVLGIEDRALMESFVGWVETKRK